MRFGRLRVVQRAAGGGLLAVAVVALSPGVAAAFEGQSESFELPRDPDSLDPVLGVEVHLSLVFPIEDQPVCPSGADCVIGFGGGIGGSVERRWPSGFTLGLAYDAWFLDSHGVFELGVMQELRAQVRKRFMRAYNIHPFVGAGLGALLFGDTLKVSTLGFAADILVGVEVELTQTIMLTAGIPVRLFTTPEFTTPRDGVARAEDLGVNATISVQLGFVVVESP